MNATYRLARHVRACADADCVIFLDLKRDRYLGVKQSAAAQMLSSVAGLPPDQGDGMHGDGRARAGKHGHAEAKLVARLLAMQLIEPASGAPAPENSNLPKLVSEARPDTVGVHQSGTATKARFALACVHAGLVIASRRLDWAFARIAAAKHRARAVGPRHAIGDDVARFQWLRPWFPARRVCLFDSFALMHFLTGLGHAPDLVIAARARPFGAHCWVEHEGAVINDALESCASFVPIARA